jgi:hypothetical protein
MEKINFIINSGRHSYSIDGSQHFEFGKDEILSSGKTDLTYGQSWHQDGFTTFEFLNETDFQKLYQGLTDCVKKIIADELNTNTDGFELERYHDWVSNNTDHLKIVSRTRDLFPSDFNFATADLVKKFEGFLGFSLTDVDPVKNKQLHVIVRINRPGSNDFNPPHKDVYEVFDGDVELSPFINMWIPVCGVTEKSSLPIVPRSHLLPESKILRTRKGAEIAGNNYRVRLVREWNGSNELIRAEVGYGEVLCFSPYLVHGLAVNEESNLTRVSLEFRLFKQQ